MNWAVEEVSQPLQAVWSHSGNREKDLSKANRGLLVESPLLRATVLVPTAPLVCLSPRDLLWFLLVPWV